MSDDGEIRSGARVGPYTLGEELGAGASATVFVGHDRSGRPYAVKVRRRGQPELDRRFLREFESMRLLRVPGVVPVHEAGIEDEYLWFSMERVFGRPFHEPLHGEPYLIERVERTVELGRKLLTVLASLHEAGFVHRDIKPTNVLVDAGGEVHVLDFGIGRYFGDNDTLSNSGEVLGTVPYMSPEQLSGLPCDSKVDLFATGLMLHEAIAGKRQRPSTTVGWIPKICLERLPALASLYREVPRGLSHLVEALLAVDPRDRPTAREAALELQRIASGVPSAEWPEPPFVDPGEWWHPLEGCIGHRQSPPVWVLEGASGSGRSRLAEQLHRVALLQGTWTLHLHCRIDRVGGPVLELLEVLVAQLDDAALAEAIGDTAPALRAMWPHLPLPLVRAEGGAAPAGGLAEALAQVIARVARSRPLLLVLHDLEQVDLFTARILPLLAARASDALGILLVHESRWATSTSRELVAQLRRDHGAGVLTVPKLPAATAATLAAAVCPASPPAVDRPIDPQGALEAAWKALAEWRNEPFEPPDASLVPLAVHRDPIPRKLLHALAAGQDGAPWVRIDERGASLSGRAAVALTRARLSNLKRGAAALANAWEHTLGHRPEGAGDLASLWLLAGDVGRAWAPAARAAVHAEQFELYADARQWLLLLDTLPPSSRREPQDDFELALVQARVALYSDTAVRPQLLETVEALARTDEQAHRVRLLHAEYGLRTGHARQSLVAALRVGSPGSGAAPHLQVQALLVAVRCRIVLQQLAEALRDLERAEAVLAEHPHPILEVRASNARAELALLQDDLLWCRALCQKNIRSASQQRYVRGIAEAAHRLGRVLRMLGRRREAEHQIRSAREAFAATGDVALDAETGLALATLLVERGEALPARHLLDETIRRIRGLAMDHLLPAGMRVALQVATLTADPTDAALALVGIEEVKPAARDPETPAALVHWWRTRGDLDRALAVEGPDQPRSFGAVLWRIERARACLSAGRAQDALLDGRAALDRATELGFAELQVYARLVIGAVTDLDAETWSELLRRATSSMFTEVFLGALEMDARRLQRTDPEAARTRWRTLLGRSQELGYRPGVEEATGWLLRDDAPERVAP